MGTSAFVVVRAASAAGVAEEAGLAYKDLGMVVDVRARTGLSQKGIAR